MDTNGNGMIMSSYSQHLVQHSQTLDSKGLVDIAFGGLGSFGRSKRQNFRTIIKYGSDGANALITTWGDIFRHQSRDKKINQSTQFIFC